MTRFAVKLATAIAGLTVLTCSVANTLVVPSGSMVPTIRTGSLILSIPARYGLSTANLPLGSASATSGRLPSGIEPHRGDIVLFRLNAFQGRKIIKRVIGLPGDHVSLTDNTLTINGRKATRTPSAKTPCDDDRPERLCASQTEEITGLLPAHLIATDPARKPRDIDTVVPAGKLLVLGDNRDHSLDSRYGDTDGGTSMVPMSRLIGEYAGTLMAP